MQRYVSQGAGSNRAIGSCLNRAIISQGGSPISLEFLTERAGQPLVNKIAELLAVRNAVMQTWSQVLIRYGQSLSEVIQPDLYTAGVDPDINADNFSHNAMRSASLSMYWYAPGRKITAREVEANLFFLGLRSVDMFELATFGSAFPHVQLAFPIVALGQSWRRPDGITVAGCLDKVGEGEGEKRRLTLRNIRLAFARHYAFLATPIE